MIEYFLHPSSHFIYGKQQLTVALDSQLIVKHLGVSNDQSSQNFVVLHVRVDDLIWLGLKLPGRLW
jgi:hypothetical protein